MNKRVGGVEMSWDIIAQDLPADANVVKEIPDDFRPAPIGSRAALIEMIAEVAPEVDFSDPSWGVIDGEGWSIEISTGNNELCSSITFHVRGDETAVGIVAAMLERLKLRALDCQTGEFFAVGPEALASFRRWRDYRDRIVGDSRIE